MDKNAIKKYAVWARNELIARVTQKAEQYEITEKKTTPADADSIGGKVLTSTEKKQRQALITKINQDGFELVMEEVAYTWFNRFTALRFMEVNNYLPSHTRVFTNESGEFKPQILADAIQLDIEGLDLDRVYELKDANKTEELYKYLLITQCNALSSILPRMFQRIEHYTELLLPDYLLREGSVIEQMVTLIPESDFNVNTENGQIEILGWLYQYYISEKHEEVIDPLHGKVVKKEEIPAATQLFTTDWVVRYIVDNSVGRYWVERTPNSKLQDELQYFVHIDSNVTSKPVTPQEVTVLDPCIGSGHFAVYAFEVLMKIYLEYGYSEREAAAEIVKHNIFGLDIDGRAAQLAYFSIMMKARQYDRRFLTKGIQPNIFEIQETSQIDKASLDYFCNSESLKNEVQKVVDLFKNAKNYGSIIKLPPIDFETIEKRFDEISEHGSLFNVYLLGEFKCIIETAKILSRRYAIVDTNPPYMNKYDSALKDYIGKYYSDYKGDLFSVFMCRNLELCQKGGFSGFMTPMVWMFIKTYEKLRALIVAQKTITTLIQFEYSAYEEATVPICSFVLKNDRSHEKGCYFRLSDFRGGMEVQKQKVLEALSNCECGYYFEADQDNFEKVPGRTIAYWWSNFSIFDLEKISEYYESAGRNKTHGNDLYVRNWWEISDVVRWQPYANGGEFRRWAGNDLDVVDWSEAAKKSYASHGGLYNQKYAGKQGICWNLITSYKNGFRIKHGDHHYSSAAPTIISTGKDYDYYVLAFLNGCVAEALLKMYNPTLNTTVGDVLGLPLKIDQEQEVVKLSKEVYELSQSDWDCFETSNNYAKHPFCQKEYTLISDAYNAWKDECENRFNLLKEKEEHLNELFISIYGLTGDITPVVDEKDVTVHKADLERDIRSFISYAVGCMFGRYSLEKDGLIYTGGKWDESMYGSFSADKDNILPICDDEYFDDDIVALFIRFVEIVFGKENLEKNLSYIASALGGKGASRDIIRDYFLNGFYADHIKVYQKRPIYWLFESGKKNGFKCLVYLHRYQSDTIARIRTDYVHELQSRYRTALLDLEMRLNGASTSERVKLTKQQKTIKEQADELRKYEEKIHHFADQMISLSLDDGVKVNYAKLQDVLAKIK